MPWWSSTATNSIATGRVWATIMDHTLDLMRSRVLGQHNLAGEMIVSRGNNLDR
jgi:hypothetical protein